MKTKIGILALMLSAVLCNFSLAQTIEHMSATMEAREDFDYYFDLGKKHSDKNEYEEAIQYFEKARTFKQADYELFFFLGVLYFRTGKVDIGMDYLKKAVELEPNEYAINMTLGTNLFNMGKLEDSLPFFEKCAEIEPSKDAPYIAVGVASERMGDYQKALMYFEKGLEVNPDQPTINYELAKLYQVKFNDLHGALGYIRKALEFQQDGDSYLVLGSIYFQLKEYESAKEALKKSIKCNVPQLARDF